MRDFAAPKRCEMCGALTEGVEPDGGFYRDAMIKFASWLTHTYAHNGRYARLLAQFIMFPDDSVSKCARRIGVSRQRGFQLLAELEKDHPALAGVFNSRRPAVAAQRRRRARECEND